MVSMICSGERGVWGCSGGHPACRRAGILPGGMVVARLTRWRFGVVRAARCRPLRQAGCLPLRQQSAMAPMLEALPQRHETLVREILVQVQRVEPAIVLHRDVHLAVEEGLLVGRLSG